MSEDIEQIKERNKRVELDKAWETSWTRRGIITLITYVIALWWLIVINESNPVFKAFIPTGGYVLSTLSMNAVKKRWITKRIAK